MNAVLRAHPRLLWLVTFAATVAAGALAAACLSLASGCGSLPQSIASGAAAVDVAAERAIVAWVDDQAQQIEDDVAADGGTSDDWCNAMAPVHRTAQRVMCAARALGDLALAGQEIIDTAGADSADWQDWLSAVPGVLAALQSAFGAADYDPPPTVDRALRALRAILGVTFPSDEAVIECEVTDYPEECSDLDAP